MAHRKGQVTPHTNAPAKLVKLWQRMDSNYYKTAQKRKINPGWVYALIVHGREPKREDLRKKLYLSNKKTKEELEHLKQQRKQKREKLNKQIVDYFSHIMEVLNGEGK